MSPKRASRPAAAPASSSSKPRTQEASASKPSIFSIPRPIKYLFESTPLITYEANKLPARSRRDMRRPVLYVFSTEEDAARGRPSFNPACLKWQTFLKIADIPHVLHPSTNHASPTGILPFLLPSSDTYPPQANPQPIPSSGITNYAQTHSGPASSSLTTPSTPRLPAYQSLLDTSIRTAWTYAVYLSPASSHIPQKFYIHPSSSNPLVRLALSYQLTNAAKKAILDMSTATPPIIDVCAIYTKAEEAFEALSLLLGNDEYFFEDDDLDLDNQHSPLSSLKQQKPSHKPASSVASLVELEGRGTGGEGAVRGEVGLKEPSLFDAGVFAYTHLLLDEGMGWGDERLVGGVRRWGNLVRHRERMVERYFGEVDT